MTDRLESMMLLVAVADAGSFSGAARVLGVPLATVSRKIGDLEVYLKARVLHRSTRRLALTEAGQSYVAACRRVLEEIEEAERAVSGEYAAPKGDLILTTPIVFGKKHVVPVVTEFLMTYPDINIRVILSDHIIHLLEERVDLAVRVGQLPDSGMVAAGVGSIRRVLCASPSYLASHGTPIRPEDLSEHTCITFDGLFSPKVWTFGKGQQETSVPVRSRMTANTAEASIEAAIGGLGITRVLSYQVADAVKAGQLKIFMEDFEPVAWPISLVHTGQGTLPLKVRAFLDFARPKLSERLKDVEALLASTVPKKSEKSPR